MCGGGGGGGTQEHRWSRSQRMCWPTRRAADGLPVQGPYRNRAKRRCEGGFEVGGPSLLTGP